MSVLKFYYCGACGIMSMKNFRDDSCPACHVAMNVNEVTVEVETEISARLNVIDLPAPHIEDDPS